MPKKQRNNNINTMKKSFLSMETLFKLALHLGFNLVKNTNLINVILCFVKQTYYLI
jgi:hypothetical protein